MLDLLPGAGTRTGILFYGTLGSILGVLAWTALTCGWARLEEVPQKLEQEDEQRFRDLAGGIQRALDDPNHLNRLRHEKVITLIASFGSFSLHLLYMILFSVQPEERLNEPTVMAMKLGDVYILLTLLFAALAAVSLAKFVRRTVITNAVQDFRDEDHHANGSKEGVHRPEDA